MKSKSKIRTSFLEIEPSFKLCMVAAAVIGSAVVGAAVSSDASRHAANTQSDAANAAANSQLSATNSTNALNWAVYQQNLKNYQPAMRSGNAALAALTGGLGLGSIYNQPGTTNNLGQEQGQTQPTVVGINPDGTPKMGIPTPVNGGMASAQGVPGQQGLGTIGQVPGVGDTSVQNYGLTDQESKAASDQYAGKFTGNYAPTQLDMDPSYQWRLSQGLKNLQASAAARGGLLTGQGAKDINDYAQGAASQEYQAAFDRNRTSQQDLYNRLASLAGVGQTATGASGAAGQTAAGNIGANTLAGVGSANNYLTSGAAAQAAGGVGSANAWSGGLSNAATNWTTLQYLNGGTGSQGGTPSWTDSSVTSGGKTYYEG